MKYIFPIPESIRAGKTARQTYLLTVLINVIDLITKQMCPTRVMLSTSIVREPKDQLITI